MIESPELPSTCEHEHLSLTDKDVIYYCERCGKRFKAEQIQSK